MTEEGVTQSSNGEIWSDDEIENALITFFSFFMLLTSTLFLGRIFFSSDEANHTNNRQAQNQYASSSSQRNDSTVRQQVSQQNSPNVSQNAEGLLPYVALDDDPEHTKIGHKIIEKLKNTSDYGKTVSKGSVIVIAFREEDLINNVEITKIIRSLSCVCNLFCVLEVEESQSLDQSNGYTFTEQDQIKKVISIIRKAGVSEKSLADHRILGCRGIIGRVAIIRQLGNAQVVSLVLDHDEGMKDQLTRFGFNVLSHKAEDALLQSLISTQ